jgi:ubiquinone biosynthesis protein UbiJ
MAGNAGDEFDLRLGWAVNEDRDTRGDAFQDDASASNGAAAPAPAEAEAGEFAALREEVRTLHERLHRLETSEPPQITEFGDVLERVTKRVADLTLEFNALVREWRETSQLLAERMTEVEARFIADFRSTNAAIDALRRD